LLTLSTFWAQPAITSFLETSACTTPGGGEEKAVRGVKLGAGELFNALVGTMDLLTKLGKDMGKESRVAYMEHDWLDIR